MPVHAAPQRHASLGPICSGDLEETSALHPGDLLRTEGSSSNTWYYTGDGRYTIPHGSIYESWWGNDACTCAQVKMVPEDVAHDILLMGNLTIQPGAFIIKINSDPTLYVIEAPYTVRKTSESVLAEIYGERWTDLVRSVPDYFFVD